MSKTERSASEKLGNATHWPSMSATRTPPTGPENGRPEIWVDADAALMASTSYWWSGFSENTDDDDLDLVAQTLLEGRAQRPVDEAAGEHGLGRGATLATEEASGDLADGIHALFDVDRQREEVELVLRLLAGGRGGQQHRVVVEVRRDGAAGLLGQASRSRSGRCGCRSEPLSMTASAKVISGPSMWALAFFFSCAAHIVVVCVVPSSGRLALVRYRRTSGACTYDERRSPQDAVTAFRHELIDAGRVA